MDCKACKENRATISFVAHEADMSRMERTIRRLWILSLVLIALLFGTNGAWLWYESQFEVMESESTSISQEVDAEGGSAYVSGIGDVYYGESRTENSGN